MAVYASKTDIDEMYGVDLLRRIADRDKNGVPDPETVEKGLLAADALINAYLQAQYTLPLAVVPEILKHLAIDIAVYKIPLVATARTTEMRVRYDDALKLLDRISAGKIGLGVPPVDDDGNGIPDPGTGGGATTRKGRVLNAVRG